MANPVGRPPQWTTLSDFEKDYDGFWEWCEREKHIPDIEGLGAYMKTNRKVLFDYEAKPEFSNTIKTVKNDIAFAKKQLALKGKINPAIFCFDFKNNHGYRDQIEQKIDLNNDTENIEDIKKEIRELVRENGFGDKSND